VPAYPNSKVNVMKVSYLVVLLSKSYRVYNQSSGLVEETYNVEFDETNGSQEEQENLDDVGNEGLRITMKNMTIGDVKPKDKDDDDPSPLFQVLPSLLLLVIKIKLIM
jgi:hypothetical protein